LKGWGGGGFVQESKCSCMICSHMPPLLLMIVSKNPLSSHGAEFLGLVLDFPFVLGRLPS